jgi:DNA-3-methyladenine glycosylase
VQAIGRSFLERDATEVAPDLIGAYLDIGGRLLTITEVEAYTADDPASHSFRGLTPRNAVMFGPPGVLYVYLIYGIHHCINVVTGPPGDGQAVLIRGGLVDGLHRTATNGPGKLARVLGVDLGWNGTPALLSRDAEVSLTNVVVTARIGISKAVDWPRRWLAVDR